MIIPSNLTKPEMARVWARMEAEKIALDAQYKRKFKRLLKADYALFIDAFEKAKGMGELAYTITALNIKADPYFALYQELYSKVGAKYYFKAKERYVTTGSKQSEEEVIEIILNYLRNYAGARILGITQTTLAQMQAALANVVSGEMSISQAIKYLKKVFGFESDYRAERIARTEINAASNFGSYEWAKRSGLDLTKTWLSSTDRRTRGTKPYQRHSHIGMNGQTVGLLDLFTEPRTGERLEYPGDGSHGATAGNIINCRCTTVFTEIE
jgi:hypothetical protein